MSLAEPSLLGNVHAFTATSPDSSYAFRGSLIGAAHQFELTEAGLSWRTGRRSGLWLYPDIVSVRLSYRPTGMQARRFRADIANRAGAQLAIMSTSKQTVALMEPQAGYRGFMLLLHRRLADAGSTAVLTAGLRRPIYTALLIAVGLFALAMAALLVRALATGEWAGVIFIAGFAALFGWTIGGFLRRNRPHNYTYDDVPDELMR
jgi:hypothetical protein